MFLSVCHWNWDILGDGVQQLNGWRIKCTQQRRCGTKITSQAQQCGNDTKILFSLKRCRPFIALIHGVAVVAWGSRSRNHGQHVMRRWVPVYVSSSSLDHGLKLRGQSPKVLE
ncbi:hypothetical protein TNCV_275421 [Trichonephila clavipes]|nr:hypothetical protein TNCV_275421 [Trichonephila clavipes]